MAEVRARIIGVEPPERELDDDRPEWQRTNDYVLLILDRSYITHAEAYAALVRTVIQYSMEVTRDQLSVLAAPSAQVATALDRGESGRIWVEVSNSLGDHAGTLDP